MTPDTLEAGKHWQRTGHLAEAARAYQAVLAREPDNLDALHLLGTLALQVGQPDRAVDLFGRAIALRPGEPAYHANLGAAYRALGQLDQAADCCRRAVSLRPNSPDLRANLGAVLLGQGQVETAVAELR